MIKITSTLFMAMALVLSAFSPALAQPEFQEGTPLSCTTDEELWEKVALAGSKPVFTSEGIAWEDCKWNWQSNDVGVSINLSVPESYQATVTLSDGTVAAYRGTDGLVVADVVGYTLRYVEPYPADHWVHDDCQLLAHELAFGLRRDPAYTTIAGNLTCDSIETMSVDVCPVDANQVAALIGGEASQWTAPDAEDGAWMFKAGEGQFIVLKVPFSLDGAAAVIQLDYWDGDLGAPASFYPGEGGIGLNEASFHCRGE